MSTPDHAAPVQVKHRPELHRFEAIVDGATCVADYIVAGQVMSITHTEVPARVGGRGIAAALTRAALDHARATGLKVRPLCSYARRYMQRHPDTLSLLA